MTRRSEAREVSQPMPRFHHVGCAVKNIDDSTRIYRDQLGFQRVSKIFTVAPQNVQVRFIEVGPSTYLELVQPLAAGSFMDRFLGVGFYHACFLTRSIETALGGLGKEFTRISEFKSEAFAGNRCAFVLTPERHLIELVEMEPEDFQKFFDSAQ